MLLVGLTGGIASGKSLVARIFRDEGAYVIDADRIVHDLLTPGRDVSREVQVHFGPSIVLPDGTIDRRKLGDIVFNNPIERAWLNQCIHPRVFEAYHAEIAHLRERRPDAIVVLDAALLIETGYHRRMDKVVVVVCAPGEQIRRMMERDRFTREQALTRIASQMPLEEKRASSDYIIENNGTREDAERRAREIFEKLRQDAARRD
jgi:dephospho-CoA kinase